MGSEASIRSRRLAGTIRKQLSAELGRDIADPRLLGVSVKEVELSADLTLATATVRIDYGDDSEPARRALLKLLERLAPRLRSTLAPQLRMRRVPDLKFRYDVGEDHSRRIAEVLDEIRREDAERARVRDSGEEGADSESKAPDGTGSD